jgi:hypothetical protein
MRFLLTITALLTVVAVAVPACFAGGKPQGVTLITDTRGGDGHPASTAVQGYRFTTDTLGGTGGPQVSTVFRDSGFSWADAGVGAATVAGSTLILLGSGLVLLRRRHSIAV